MKHYKAMGGLKVAAAALAAAIATATATAGAATERGNDGHLIRDTRDMRGCALFVNAQRRVDVAAGIDSAIAALDAEFHYDLRRMEAGREVSPANASELRRALKATAAVFVVDRPDLPALTALPDERVALLNVAPLAAGGTEGRRLSKRIRTEALRAFAFAFGAGFSQYDSIMMSSADSPVELDLVPAKAFLPFDTVLVIRKIAASRGLAPYRMEFYETACEEGWAPMPSNDLQKAVWDKVHQLPTEPIKILPETKKVKE